MHLYAEEMHYKLTNDLLCQWHLIYIGTVLPYASQHLW